MKVFLVLIVVFFLFSSLFSLVWYRDVDLDGWGNEYDWIEFPTQPNGYVAQCCDCDDGDSFVYPGADEYCNGIDDDCDGEIDEEDAIDCQTYYIDFDQDGYGAGIGVCLCSPQFPYTVLNSDDCDDNDHYVNPGAEEYCNGIDDDCDTEIDEDAVDMEFWYLDSDQDGYGDPNISEWACDPPVDYVYNSDDCDDNNADIYPGADEYCNGIDDDCDTEIDEEDAIGCVTYYIDFDQDGYGGEVSVCLCSPQYPYEVLNSDDCDDSDPTVNPESYEICDNFIDDNCNEQTDETDCYLEAPKITLISDIPNDQGRNVLVSWRTSYYDYLGFDYPITGFGLWELYPYPTERDVYTFEDLSEIKIEENTILNFRDTLWTNVAYIPAMQWSQYYSVAGTFVDSTNIGSYDSFFFVSAHTVSPAVHYESEIAYGYSVDNIAPDETDVIIAQNGINIGLSWDEVEYGTYQSNSYPEINGIWYKIYAGDSPDFVCDEIHLIDTIMNLNYVYPLIGEEKKFFKIVVSDQP